MTLKNILFLIALYCCLTACAKDEESSPTEDNYSIIGPAGELDWQFLPEFSDEFSGSSLNSNKWWPYNPEWKGREPGYFNPNNVSLSNGWLNIVMKEENLGNLPEGYHTYTCGAVQSKRTILYGYFEVRARPMNSRGSSSFWFYKAESDWWTEIDVYEIGAAVPGMEKTVHMNVHVFRTPEDGDNHWEKHEEWQAPFNLAEDFHVYGLEWNTGYIKFYIDSVLVRTVENSHWHQALSINFDSETMPDWFGLPELETLPSTYSVDYLRVWKRKE
jgi:beta-glucanase (GH16 family)